MRFPLPNATMQIFWLNRERELNLYLRSPSCTAKTVTIITVLAHERRILGRQKLDDDRHGRNGAHS
jgi:hypothetical protein